MAHLETSPRVGRSQGATIFWGLVSVFFAAAACFYFWQNYENEINADKLRDEVIALQDERDTLNSEKAKLQASMSEDADQLKTREDLVQEKETDLAAEEARLETVAQKPPPPPALTPTLSQSALFKKFADTAHDLVKDDAGDVVTRGGRPVLRLANTVLFAPGDATLKSEAPPLLALISKILNGQADDYELRVECFTDTEAENSKPHYATSWDLTSARAAAIARYFRDQTSLPFQNVLVIARGDSEPIVTGPKESHARNRRVEITLAPVIAPLAPPPDAPVPGKAK